MIYRQLPLINYYEAASYESLKRGGKSLSERHNLYFNVRDEYVFDPIYDRGLGAHIYAPIYLLRTLIRYHDNV